MINMIMMMQMQKQKVKKAVKEGQSSKSKNSNKSNATSKSKSNRSKSKEKQQKQQSKSSKSSRNSIKNNSKNNIPHSQTRKLAFSCLSLIVSVRERFSVLGARSASWRVLKCCKKWRNSNLAPGESWPGAILVSGDFTEMHKGRNVGPSVTG